MRKLAAFITFNFVLISAAFAATYYVKVGGSDSASGADDANAWANVAKVNSVATAGDTVNFKRGSSFSTDAALNPGANNITYQDYGSGALPILNRAHNGTTIAVIGRTGIQVTNIEIINSNSDGMIVQSAGSATCTGCVAHDNDNDGFKVKDASSVLNLVNCTSYNHNDGVATDGFSAHQGGTATLTNFTAYNNTQGVSNEKGTTCTLNGGTLYSNTINARIANSGSGSASLTLNKVLLRDSTQDQITDSGVPGSFSVNQCIIKNTPTGYYGINLSSSTSSLSALNNDFYSGGGGIFVNFTATIKNNIFDNLESANYLDFNDSADMTGSTITYNLFDVAASSVSSQSGYSSSFGSATGDIYSSTSTNFTDATNNDFSLVSTSSAIESGVKAGFTTDYAGNSIGSVPEIGAYEYTGTYSKINGGSLN